MQKCAINDGFSFFCYYSLPSAFLTAEEKQSLLCELLDEEEGGKKREEREGRTHFPK